jgi:hypothetical protein
MIDDTQLIALWILLNTIQSQVRGFLCLNYRTTVKWNVKKYTAHVICQQRHNLSNKLALLVQWRRTPERKVKSASYAIESNLFCSLTLTYNKLRLLTTNTVERIDAKEK